MCGNEEVDDEVCGVVVDKHFFLRATVSTVTLSIEDKSSADSCRLNKNKDDGAPSKLEDDVRSSCLISLGLLASPAALAPLAPAEAPAPVARRYFVEAAGGVAGTTPQEVLLVVVGSKTISSMISFLLLSSSYSSQLFVRRPAFPRSW